MTKHPVLYAALLAVISSTIATSATARECDLGTFSVPGEEETENNNGGEDSNSGEGSSPGSVISGDQTVPLGEYESSLMLHNFDMKFATFTAFDPETGTFVDIHPSRGDLPCQALMQVGGSNSAWSTSDKPNLTQDYYDAFTFTSFKPNRSANALDGQGTFRKYIVSAADGEPKSTLEFRLKAKNGSVSLSAASDLRVPGFGLPQAMPVGTHVEVTANTALLAGTLLTVRYWSNDEQAPMEIGQPLLILLPFGSYVSQIQQGWFADEGFQGSGELVISSLPWTQSPD